MRYSRWALLLFGAGLLLGLAAVSAEIKALDRVASAAMAFGLVALPATLVADWWRYRPWNDLTPRRRTRARSSHKAKRSPSPRGRKTRGR